MNATINSVCTLNDIKGNRLILEVMPNGLKNNQLQFYYIGKNNKDIKFVDYHNFENQVEKNLQCNRVLYITFCGISNQDCDIPEYLYYTFNGNEVTFSSENKNNSVLLFLNLNKKGKSLEQEINNLFTDNVGVFIQSYC